MIDHNIQRMGICLNPDYRLMSRVDNEPPGFTIAGAVRNEFCVLFLVKFECKFVATY